MIWLACAADKEVSRFTVWDANQPAPEPVDPELELP